MEITDLLANKRLLDAKSALDRANVGDIIELCENYIKLLTEYRDELYAFRGTPEINLIQANSVDREKAEQSRKSLRTALEFTTQERNHTELLLKSFTAISGYEAVNTFNQLEYNGFSDWELRSNRIQSGQAVESGLNIQEAVETASLLRRNAYLTDKTTFFA